MANETRSVSSTAHRESRQADGTARARTLRKGRPGASPPSLRDERYARCKRIPRPNGRRIRHTPRGADVSRTNPVSPCRTPFGRRGVASGDVGPARCPALNPRASARGGCQAAEDVIGAAATEIVCCCRGGCIRGRSPFDACATQIRRRSKIFDFCDHERLRLSDDTVSSPEWVRGSCEADHVGSKLS